MAIENQTSLRFPIIQNRISSMLIFLFVFCLSIQPALSQDKGTISGTVTELNTGEAIIGANIVVKGHMLGASTDLDGRYNIVGVPIGDQSVEVTFIGYQKESQSVFVTPGQTSVASFQIEEIAVGLDAVVVTGTRSKGRSAMESAVPIDAFDSELMERQGNGDLTETLKQLIPSYSATPLTGDGAAFVRPTSLRGLPPDDVLILMNSKRRHRSALIAHFGAAMNVGAHASDVGQIPSIAIKTVEVLRDGASAQYGSDAIAGVMNFILKDASEGLEVQAQSGKWYGRNYGSETDYKIAGNLGLPLSQNGFLNISGEYGFNEELSRGDQHLSAIGVEGAQDPAMNWGRPESSGFRSIWNAGMALNDNLNFYSFGNFAKTYGNYSFFYRAPGKKGALEAMPLDPNDPSQGNFSWGDTFPAGFTPRFEGFQTDISGIAGLKGTMGNGILYDVSGSYGTNKLHYVLNGSLNASWGPDSPFKFEPGDLQQEELNFNLDVAKAISNELNLAAGAEWRKETYTMFEGDMYSWKAGPWAEVGQLINPEIPGDSTYYGNPGLTANGFAGTSPDVAGSFSGSNIGVYFDAEWDVSDALLVQGAVRFEDYTEFGNTLNGKVAARFHLSDKLTLRGAVSTGFRAPTPGQANVSTITTSFDGVTGTQVLEGTVSPTHPLAISMGGKALIPENALNLSFGFASRVTSSMNLTLDFYQIKVDDRIIKSRSLAVPESMNVEFSELAFYTNSLSTQTQGLDLVMTYSHGFNTDISLAYNYNATEVLSQTQVNGQNPVSDGTIYNIENNLPKHRASAIFVHRMGKMAGMARANYYGGTKDERGGSIGADHEDVGSEVLVDVELSYQLSPSIKLIGGANNVLDNYPDMIDTRVSQGMPFPRRTPIGYNGGMFYLRAVFSL